MVAKADRFGALATVVGTTLVTVGLLMLVVEVRPAEATFPGKNGKIAERSEQKDRANTN